MCEPQMLYKEKKKTFLTAMQQITNNNNNEKNNNLFENIFPNTNVVYIYNIQRALQIDQQR